MRLIGIDIIASYIYLSSVEVSTSIGIGFIESLYSVGALLAVDLVWEFNRTENGGTLLHTLISVIMALASSDRIGMVCCIGIRYVGGFLFVKKESSSNSKSSLLNGIFISKLQDPKIHDPKEDRPLRHKRSVTRDQKTQERRELIAMVSIYHYY